MHRSFCEWQCDWMASQLNKCYMLKQSFFFFFCFWGSATVQVGSSTVIVSPVRQRCGCRCVTRFCNTNPGLQGPLLCMFLVFSWSYIPDSNEWIIKRLLQTSMTSWWWPIHLNQVCWSRETCSMCSCQTDLGLAKMLHCANPDQPEEQLYQWGRSPIDISK